jgi:hypothetical protein
LKAPWFPAAAQLLLLAVLVLLVFGSLGVCPMEFLTYWAGRIGLRRRVPGLLKSGWVVA